MAPGAAPAMPARPVRARPPAAAFAPAIFVALFAPTRPAAAIAFPVVFVGVYIHIHTRSAFLEKCQMYTSPTTHGLTRATTY